MAVENSKRYERRKADDMSGSTRTLAEGTAALRALIEAMSHEGLDLNEADTRHRFIDGLLHDCLGWDRAVTKLERQLNGDYSDYELGKPPQVVLEAKRAGITFELPSEGTESVLRSLRSLTKGSPDFKAAFEQALRYCADRGIQTGVVANSTQIVIFLGVRSDGVPPSDGRCLAFSGYEHLEKHFNRLWQAISPDAISKKLLLGELTSPEPTGIPPRLSTYVPGYPSFRYPSEAQQSLKTLSDILIEDAPHTPALLKKFLEECYCESGALQKEALLGKNILAARYAALFNPSEEAPTLQPIKADSQQPYGLSAEIVGEALGRRPIVIVGDVGVGKTSFIRHLIFVTAAQEMENAMFLYLDLGSTASLGQAIQSFLLGELERQLLIDHKVDIHEDNFVRGVYHGDLLRFEKGVWGKLKEAAPERYLERQIEHLAELCGNRAEHLKNCISHLSKGRKKQVLICIDNADQRDSKTQQDAFLAAQEFAGSWQALVLISIRPRTYFTSKSSGSISAYPQRILTIAPPRIDLVLQRRLQFSLDLAEGRAPLKHLEGITLKLDSIAWFLRALIHSLRRNKDLNELLANITGGNIREALELIKGFIGSANVDSEKIIEIMRAEGEYTIPVHEFSKQALLGEYSHYDAKSSIAFNLYGLKYPDAHEHFLSPLIVSYLLADSSERTTEGFVSTAAIVEEMQTFGFVPDQVESSLRRLSNKKLVETSERITFDEGLQDLVGDMPLAFRATTIGSYHVNRWAASFSYLDAVLIDTPILDSGVRERLIPGISSFDLRDRFRRSIAFAAYLDQCWNTLASKRPSYFDWNTLRKSASESFEPVRRAVEKMAIKS